MGETLRHDKVLERCEQLLQGYVRVVHVKDMGSERYTDVPDAAEKAYHARNEPPRRHAHANLSYCMTPKARPASVASPAIGSV